MFIVVHDPEGYGNVLDAISEEGVMHDTLEAAFADVKNRVSCTSYSPEDYTIFVGHKIKTTLSID